MAKKPRTVVKPSVERARRPKLQRTKPNRSVFDLLQGKSAQPRDDRSPPDPNAAKNTASEAVKRGVEMGYRVVEEYVKQGASVASSFANQNRPRNGASEQDLSKMTERMMQYASDFTSLWYDAMGMMMNAQPGATGRPTGAAEPSNGAASHSSVAERPSSLLGYSRIVLDVKASRQIEVIVAIDELLSFGVFTVEELKGQTNGTSIKGARFEPASDAQGPLTVRVHVSRAVGPGRYTGAVIDSAGKPRGRLTVIVGK